jgi:hypothetical protein
MDTHEKTIADVADKVVDRVSGGIEQIAEAAKKLAPGAWESVVRAWRIGGILDVSIGVEYG